MKKHIGLRGIILVAFLMCYATSYSQTVVVTDDNTYTTGNASSVLDVKSTTKGFLIPRMTAAQRTAISSPATGLMVYQTDGTTGFYYYDGSAWRNFIGSTGANTITTLGTITTGTWNGTTIGTTYGGTGLTSYTLGDVPYASAANTLSKLAGNTTASKMFLSQTGNGSVSAAPAWSAIAKSDVGLGNVENTALSTWAGSTNLTTLGTVATGTWNATTIGVTKGGTGLTSATLGDLHYASAANTFSNLAGNTSTTRKVLTQTGNGTVSAAPAWNQLAVADISDIATNYSPIAGSSSITTVGTIGTGTWNATTIGTTKGGTGLTSYTLGDIPYASAANTLSNLAGNTTATKKFLNQTGNGTISAAPTWSALTASDVGLGSVENTALSTWTGSTNLTTLGTVATGTWNATTIGVTKGGSGLTSIALGDLHYGSAANTISNLSGNTSTTRKVLTQTGNGTVSAAPAWNQLAVADISDIATNYSPIAGSSSITTVGTIGTGTWNATTIGTTKGGTGLTSYTLGDIPYASAANTLSNLAGNTTATKKFLNQTGNGTISAAPTWSALTASDVGLGSVENTALSTWTGSTNLTTLGTVATGTWNATTIGVTKGGTGLTSATLGDIHYASAANTISNLAGNTTTTRKFLTQTGNGTVSAAPAWNTVSSTDIDANVSATEFGYLSGVTSDIQTQLGTKAASGANTDITSLTLNQTGLNIKGATATALTIKPNETLTAARTFNIITGDADRTLSLAGNLTTSGSNALTLTTTGATNVTLPTTGTLVNSAVTSLSSLAGVGTITTGTWNGTAIDETFGGTGLTSYTLGDVTYASAANTLSKLAGNTTATKMFLSQTGTGSTSAAPAWSAVSKSDVGLGSVENTALSTWGGSTNITTLGTIATGTWNGTDIAVADGGTGINTATAYGLLAGGTTSTGAFQSLSTGSSGQILRSSGSGALPAWSTATYPATAGTSGKILVSDGTNIVSSTPTFPNASATSGKMIKSDGTNWVASTETYAAPGTTGNILESDGTNWTSVANDGGWGVYKVSGSNATTTGTTLTNITGLVTSTLAVNTSYEFEAVLNCGTSAVTTGTKYGVNVTVAPTLILAQYSGTVTSTTGAVTTTTANNTASATTFLTTSSTNGIIIIKGIFTTAGTGSPVFSIQHLKVTSGTSTVRIGSILRIKAL